MREFDNNSTSYDDKERYGEYGSLNKLYGKPRLEDIIELEWKEKRGRLLIISEAEFRIAATGSDLQDQVQEIAQRYVDREVRLLHLAFAPREY